MAINDDIPTTSSSSTIVDIEKQTFPIGQHPSASFDCNDKESIERGENELDTLSNDDDESEDERRDEGRPASLVERVLSRVTSRSSVDPGPPPDGGWRAWNACLASHLVITNTWGWINSFGTFQSLYTDMLNRPSSDISWIGSIMVFLLFFIGTFTGRLVDAGYFRPIFLLGIILQVGGIFATSFCKTYWQFLLAQGIGMGIGAGCMFCPLLAIVSTYFQKKRALALGIGACGSATGGLVFPSMVRQLLPRVGFARTIRAIGFIQLATLAIAYLLVKPRIKPRKSGPLVEWAAFKELEYTFYAAGSFFCFWGVYFAFYYLAAFARDALDPPLSYSNSLDLLLILNGVGIAGRLVPNHLADRYGAINIFIPVSIAASILAFSWIAVSNTTGLYVWAVFYGTIASGIQSLFPAGLSFLTTDLRKIGVRMGMIFTLVSFATLTGPPIAGAIIDASGNYKGAQAFSGSVIATGAGFLFAAKVVKMKKTEVSWTGRV
ncbi:Fc.00g012570.m01.CDS01 [Cosmosporella sp. VM-42]